MPTYISLINWTDQGVRNSRQTVERAKQARSLLNAWAETSRAPTGRSARRTSFHRRVPGRRVRDRVPARPRSAGQHRHHHAAGVHR